MPEPTAPRKPLGPPPRGITQSDVSHAADCLLRAGERPAIDKVRAKIGKGSPNTVNPLLDAWWKTVAARLDAGPAALHRPPETVAHIAEAPVDASPRGRKAPCSDRTARQRPHRRSRQTTPRAALPRAYAARRRTRRWGHPVDALIRARKLSDPAATPLGGANDGPWSARGLDFLRITCYECQSLVLEPPEDQA